MLVCIGLYRRFCPTSNAYLPVGGRYGSRRDGVHHWFDVSLRGPFQGKSLTFVQVSHFQERPEEPLGGARDSAEQAAESNWSGARVPSPRLVFIEVEEEVAPGLARSEPRKMCPLPRGEDVHLDS